MSAVPSPTSRMMDMLRHGLGAHARIGMGQAAKLVRQGLTRLVREGVGVHCIKSQTMGFGMLAQFNVVRTFVPREMW